MNIFGHGGEVQAVEPERISLIKALAHQPTWLSLLIIAFFLFGMYDLLDKLKVKPMKRVLMLALITLLIAVIYMPHNPAVTTVLLLGGFVVTFVLAFTLMRGQKGEKPDKSQE